MVYGTVGMMRERCVWEHNGDDTLLYSADRIGAYTRGADLAEAVAKMPEEIASYSAWAGGETVTVAGVEIIQEKISSLQIANADSDVLFDAERLPLSREEYTRMKALVLRSARDVDALFASVPDPDASCLLPRRTFYGEVPRTAREMYRHIRSVNAYYFGEIGIDADNGGAVASCRERGFAQLEKRQDFPVYSVTEGSYGELWSLRKVMRRFLWHDRIHARAMYRMAVRTFGEECIPNIFRFGR